MSSRHSAQPTPIGQVKSANNSQNEVSRIHALELESKRLQEWTCDNCTSASAGAWKEAIQRLREVNAELTQLRTDDLIQEIASLPPDEPLPIEVVPNDDRPDLSSTDELTNLWWQFVANRNDHDLRNRILSHYTNFIWFMVRRFLTLSGRPQSLAEGYLGAGWIGLAKAAKVYHPSKPYAFLTGAGPYVWKELQRFYGAPSKGEMTRHSLERRRRLLTNNLGRRANDFELASDLGISEEVLAKQLADSAATKHVSVGEFHGTHRAETEESKSTDPTHRVAVTDQLAHGLRFVTEDCRAVMQRHFGEDTTLREIGEDLGVSRERIRQRCEAGRQRIIENTLEIPKIAATEEVIAPDYPIRELSSHMPSWAAGLKAGAMSGKHFTVGRPAAAE